MKNTFLLLATVAALLLVGCTKAQKTGVALTWETGVNKVDSLNYEHVLTITNHGDEPLENNWVIYFCHFSKKYDAGKEGPIAIAHISGTYHKISPTSFYKPIAAGDSLSVKLRSPRNFDNVSFLPEGTFIVKTLKDGTESAPQDVAIRYKRNGDEFRPAIVKGEPQYYPFGDKLYEDNSVFMQPTTTTKTDIIPSIKSVTKGTGELNFSKDVAFVPYPASFANEAKLLENKLKDIYGCTVSTAGTTKIALAKLADDVQTQNDEHYLLDITADGVTIKGKTAHAIFNGVQTLLAMLGSESLPTTLPHAQLSDFPDLSYRGVMLDISRNFSSKENILKTIDLLAMYKLNILHMHLADDEGWRLEIPGLEELTTVGSRRGYSKDEAEFLFPAYGGGWDPNSPTSLGNGQLTRQDFIDILKYAQRNHISVIPELDFPGHSRAAIKSMNARYKKYIATDTAKAEEFLLIDFADTSRYFSAQSYRDNVINVALPSTYRFINKVVTEIDLMYKDAGMKMEVLHIGGDEVPRGSWTGSPVCKEFMAKQGMKEVKELKPYFVEQMLRMTREKNIRLAGWQEIVLNHQDDAVDSRFANDNVLSYCWNTVADEIPYKLANAGFGVIICNATNFYLDFSYNRSFDEPGHNWGGMGTEYNSFDLLPYNIYKSIRRDLRGKPIELPKDVSGKQALKPTARKQIEGVQGQVFSETIRRYDMIEYYLLPKMLGLVERGWNVEPAWSLATDNDALYKDALRTYIATIGERELARLAKLGINFRVAQPGIKIADGQLYANCPISGAKICYTTDGSEPTINSAEWKAPVACDAKLVKAKAFYCGKQSTTTLLHNP